MELLKRQINELRLKGFGTELFGREWETEESETEQRRIFELFERYMGLLLEWNEKINLTAITDPKQIITKHFTDSITVLAAVEIAYGARILDLGTGAGFPGVPIKIMRPDIRLTLVDSIKKKIGFIEALIDELELNDTRAVCGRAEELARHNEYREQYDIVCARAVAKLSVLAEYCLPFVKNGGKFIAMKARDAKDEILASEKTISCLGGRIEDVKQLEIPFTDICRLLIIVRKTGQTPFQFPRKTASILKNPIL